MDNNNSFNFTYSTKEQEEIKNIRNKYEPQKEDEDKMTKLRRLDKGVYSKAVSKSLTLGILGLLIMGTGMSLIMTDIGSKLGEVVSISLGLVTGIIGMIIACFAYPVYNRTLKREREKIAPEVLRITDELMK